MPTVYMYERAGIVMQTKSRYMYAFHPDHNRENVVERFEKEFGVTEPLH